MQVYFGTQHSCVYILASIKGENCANSMSWLVRKQAIEREGGLSVAFSEYLAEDFFMGKALWNKYGVLHVMSGAPDDGYCIVGNFQGRNLSWCSATCKSVLYGGYVLYPKLIFVEKLSQVTKFMKVFSLESFPLYGIMTLGNRRKKIDALHVEGTMVACMHGPEAFLSY